MTRALFAALLLLPLAGSATGSPFDEGGAFVPRNAVDRAVLAALRKHRIQPAPLCSDVVFVRRVFLDMTGTLPSPEEVTAFLGDTRPDKRARLIDALFERPEFADYAALRWCDLLRVKAEFPINLWPNAVQAYHHWVRDAIQTNRPYDEVARELLTASGSNFRTPAVNFWRACAGRDPAALAQAVALTRMGVRIETLPAERQAGLAALFSRVAYKSTKEWKEEIVLNDPAATEPLHALLPDGKEVTVDADKDPRAVFADWLIRRDNPWFQAAVVNRIWAWLMGRGIVHEPDDFRPDNPPSNAVLLALLGQELAHSGYDLRHVYRLILNSATYQQSPVPRSSDPKAEALFAYYPVRRLDAEVLIDAISSITGTTEKYESMIPEPFTFLPEDDRSITLEDGSITSPFLEMFGRPTRDTGLWSERNNAITGAQRLHLLNSSDIQQRIERSTKLMTLARRGRDSGGAIRAVYLLVLSRPPTADEVAAVTSFAIGGNPKQVLDDLVWALLNTKEFLYAH